MTLIRIDEKAKTVTITLPLLDAPKPSATGKTLVIAGTSGSAKTEVIYQGKQVVLNATAYVKP